MADLNITLISTLNQHQDTADTNFGFGQFAGARYRGQVFIPSVSGNIISIGFNRTKGLVGLKVYLDTATGGNVPSHSAGSELYSFVIPFPSVVDQYYVYDLPIPLAVTSGQKYCFYLAPWDSVTDQYIDDYQDAHGVATGFDEMTNNNGVWENEGGLTWNFATYMGGAEAIVVDESPTVALTIAVKVSNSITVTENPVTSSVATPNVSTSVTVSENVSILVTNLPIKVSDSITITESEVSTLVSLVNKSDSITVSENISMSTLNITVSDNVSAQDYKRNLIPNPSFEVDNTGWTNEQGARITTDFYSGIASESFIATSSFGNLYQITGQTVLANKTYTASFYYKMTVTSGNPPHVQINADTSFGQNLADIGLLAQASFFRQVITFNTGNHTQVFFRFYNNAGNVSGVFDAFQLEIGDNASPYFDGSLAGSGWDGTANNSSSTQSSANLNDIAAFNPITNNLVNVSENIQLALLSTPNIGKNENITVSENISLDIPITINAGLRKGIIII